MHLRLYIAIYNCIYIYIYEGGGMAFNPQPSWAGLAGRRAKQTLQGYLWGNPQPGPTQTGAQSKGFKEGEFSMNPLGSNRQAHALRVKHLGPPLLYIYIYVYVCIWLSLSIYIYVYIYVYIYIYIHRYVCIHGHI